MDRTVAHPSVSFRDADAVLNLSFHLAQAILPSPDSKDPRNCPKDFKKEFLRKFGGDLTYVNSRLGMLEKAYFSEAKPSAEVIAAAKKVLPLIAQMINYIDDETDRCGGKRPLAKEGFEGYIQNLSALRVFAKRIVKLGEKAESSNDFKNFVENHKSEIAAGIVAIIAAKKIIGAILLFTRAAPAGVLMQVTP